jgi:hypothetical protein
MVTGRMVALEPIETWLPIFCRFILSPVANGWFSFLKEVVYEHDSMPDKAVITDGYQVTNKGM